MRLNELFDRYDADTEVIRDDEDSYVVRSNIGSRKIEFGAISTIISGLEQWTIDFSETNEFESGSYSLTGSGNEFKVMQFVTSCLRQLLKKRNPDVIAFSSSKNEPSRTKLYARMVQRLGKDYIKKIKGTRTYLYNKRIADQIKEQQDPWSAFEADVNAATTAGEKSSRKLGDVQVTLIHGDKPNIGHVTGIKNTGQRRKGQASSLLKLLTTKADQHNIVLKVYADTFADETKKHLSRKQLKDWYGRYGFTPEFSKNGSMLIREPLTEGAMKRSLGVNENLTELFDSHEDRTYLVNKRVKEAREFSNSELGELTYGWKSKKELCDEEDNKQYIPKEYTKILELGGIFAAQPGKGQGDKLMKQFLDSPEAKKADLIFCDPVPGLGSNFKSEMSDEEQIEKLKKFYRRYGFKNNPKSHRMWLVKKGSIPDNKLPT